MFKKHAEKTKIKVSVEYGEDPHKYMREYLKKYRELEEKRYQEKHKKPKKRS